MFYLVYLLYLLHMFQAVIEHWLIEQKIYGFFIDRILLIVFRNQSRIICSLRASVPFLKWEWILHSETKTRLGKQQVFG